MNKHFYFMYYVLTNIVKFYAKYQLNIYHKATSPHVNKRFAVSRLLFSRFKTCKYFKEGKNKQHFYTCFKYFKK